MTSRRCSASGTPRRWRGFDLRDVEEVRRHAELIFARVEDGSTPCDGMWPDDQVALLRGWIDAGMPA